MDDGPAMFCEMELLWSGATVPEDCPGEAVVHVLFANGALRGVCLECLRLALPMNGRAVTDGRGTPITVVAMHPLYGICGEHNARWRDRNCA